MKHLCLLLSSMLTLASAKAQQLLSPLNAYQHQARIGLVDEFFLRFNGDEMHPDVKGNRDIVKDNMLLLCDLSRFSSRTDPGFLLADSMMQAAVDDSVRLGYADGKWMALAHCKGLLNKKEVHFDLYLRVQERGADMYKWVIQRAEGNMLDIAPKQKSDEIMIYPDDHETNFMSLNRMTTEQPFNVALFMDSTFAYCPTSAFAYLVHSGQLKIDYVEQLEFVFTQIPGFVFHLNYFDRDSGNSGWLISNFYRANDLVKEQLLGKKNILTDKALPPNQGEGMYGTEKSDSLESLAEQKKKAKEQFLGNTQARIAQATDYLTFMADTTKGADLRAYYQSKFELLFERDSKVLVLDSSANQSYTIGLDSLCRMIVSKGVKVQIASVMVPVWDDDMTLMTDSVDLIALPAMRKTLSKASAGDPDPDVKLPVFKEITEKGLVWTPIFGNLEVTVLTDKKR